MVKQIDKPCFGRKLRNRLAQLAGIIQNAKIGLYASSGAFYLFLALFPAAALLCSLLTLLPYPREELLRYVAAALPDFVQELLRDILGGTYAYNAAAFSISALLLLWSAGRAFVGLMRGLNRVYCGEDRANLLKLRGLSCLYMLAFLISMLVTLVLSLFQHTLLTSLALRWPQGRPFVEALRQMRFLPGMLLLAILFGFLFKYLPAGRRRYLDQMPGALLTSALWMLVSWIFSLCLHRFGASSVYGSLATVAFALMWIFWCVALTLVGGCFNVWLGSLRTPEGKGEKA